VVKQLHQTKMLTFAGDLPNICSLAGLLCAVFGIY
jgi:archaetidylserine synthase